MRILLTNTKTYSFELPYNFVAREELSVAELKDTLTFGMGGIIFSSASCSKVSSMLSYESTYPFQPSFLTLSMLHNGSAVLRQTNAVLPEYSCIRREQRAVQELKVALNII